MGKWAILVQTADSLGYELQLLTALGTRLVVRSPTRQSSGRYRRPHTCCVPYISISDCVPFQRGMTAGENFQNSAGLPPRSLGLHSRSYTGAVRQLERGNSLHSTEASIERSTLIDAYADSSLFV